MMAILAKKFDVTYIINGLFEHPTLNERWDILRVGRYDSTAENQHVAQAEEDRSRR
jgi:hypothetical protein